MTAAALQSMCKRPVTYLRWTANGTDAYGNPSYGHVADASPTKVWLEQVSTPVEVVVDANIQRDEWLLVDPNPNAGLTGRDQVNVGGVVFEIVGPPSVEWDDVGPHHLEARLRHVDD